MNKTKLGKFFATVCVLLSFVLIFSFAACNSDSGESGGVTLNQKTLTLDVGTKNSPILVTNSVTEDVVWTSSDESKVTVTGSGSGNRAGLVSALAVGTATITATSGSDSATCIVTVVEKEVVTIKKDGAAVSSKLTLDGKDDTLTLTATSSRNHAIEWISDKPLIASVEDGVVKAVATSGTAKITARCAQDIEVSASVTVQVGDGTDTAYELENTYSTHSVSGEHPGVWMYWNEFSNVTEATYEEGVVSVTAINLKPNANWYNIHLLYTANDDVDKDKDGDALTAGQHYKVTFDLNSTFAGRVTVNGYELSLEKGKHSYTAYYDHVDTAFRLYWGVDGKGSDFINDEEENQEIKMSLSNIEWEKSTKVQLREPSFSIAGTNGNEIGISDGNPEGSVGSYTINLYNNNEFVMSIIITEKIVYIAPDKLPKGTFKCKLIANAANAHYISTGECDPPANYGTMTGTNEHIVYTMEATSSDGAVRQPGTWTYYVSSWVDFSGKVTDGVATISFSNNAGNWTDTQVFYKVPGKAVGAKYKVIVHINNVPKEGKIQIGDTPYTLKKGDNAIEVEITETAGASVTVIFGIYPEDKKQDIQAAENIQISVELK